jgi:L-cysteine S-thiosulfotransferase
VRPRWRACRSSASLFAGLSWALLAAAQDSAVGDVERGRAIVANRQLGLCLLCHSAPIAQERFQGNLAPDLAGAGKRWTAQQLRDRLTDPSRFNPDTIMPSYARTGGLTRVAPASIGKPLLDARQIEDVVAYLASLRD